MAVVIDILAGLMTGSAYACNVGSLFGDFNKPQNIGNILFALNIERFMPLDEFKKKIDEYIRSIKGSKKAKNTTEIYMPGELSIKSD